MIRPEPFATHRLSNGWVVREHHAQRQRVFVEKAANAPSESEITRFVVRLNRRHHMKHLTVVHLIGSTPEEQARSLNLALRWAAKPTRFPMQGLWNRHRDAWYPGHHYYMIVLGNPVDEVSAFETLRRGLHTDDAIDLEFQSIVKQLEGVTA